MTYQPQTRTNQHNNMTKTITYDIDGLLVDLKLERLDHKGGLLLLTGFCNGMSVRTNNPEIDSVKERFIYSLHTAGDLGEPDPKDMKDLLNWINDNISELKR